VSRCARVDRQRHCLLVSRLRRDSAIAEDSRGEEEAGDIVHTHTALAFMSWILLGSQLGLTVRRRDVMV
jgi:hypothetical protein